MSVKNVRIRIGYTFMAVMVLLCCIGMNTITVRANETDDQDRFTIYCSPVGKTECYALYEDQQYPIEVMVKNNGGDFEGTIKLLTYSGINTTNTIALGQKAVIAAGETQKFYFVLRNSTYSMGDFKIPLRIDFLNNTGDVIARQASQVWVNVDEETTFAVGVICQDTLVADMVNSAKLKYPIYNGETSTIKLKSILLDPISLTKYDLMSVKMIIVDSNITDQSWEILSEWLAKGGHMMMNHSIYDRYIGKPLNKDNMVYWGAGAVIVYEPDTIWMDNVFYEVLPLLFGSKNMKRLQGWGSDWSWTSASTLNYDMWTKVPGVALYAMVLMIYIVLTGPVIYILLKKRSRREYLWAIIPCSAILFSGIIYVMSNEKRYTEPFVRYNSRVQLTDEGAIENSYFMVTNPNRDQAVLTVDSTADVKPLYLNYYWEEQKEFEIAQYNLMTLDYNLAMVPMEESTDILIASEGLFDEHIFSSLNYIKEDDNRFITEISYQNGQFSGSITNHTPWNMNNVFVIDEGVMILAGDLKAGETMDLTDCSAVILPQYYASDIHDINRLEKDFDMSAYGHDVNRISLQVTLTNFIIGLRDSTENDRMIVGGFTEEYDIGINENRKLQSVNGLTMVYQNAFINNVNSKPIIYGEGVTEDDRDMYSQEDYYLYTSEPINFVYDLKVVGVPTYLRWLNASGVKVEFYNNQTDEYDVVFEEQDEMSWGGLKAYVDEHDQIHARVSGEEYGYENYVPAFTVTGGVGND